MQSCVQEKLPPLVADCVGIVSLLQVLALLWDDAVAWSFCGSWSLGVDQAVWTGRLYFNAFAHAGPLLVEDWTVVVVFNMHAADRHGHRLIGSLCLRSIQRHLQLHLILDLLLIDQQIFAEKRIFQSRLRDICNLLCLFVGYSNVAHLHLHLKIRDATASHVLFLSKGVFSAKVVLIEGPVVLEDPAVVQPRVLLVDEVLMVLSRGADVRMLKSLVLDWLEWVGFVEGVVLDSDHQQIQKGDLSLYGINCLAVAVVVIDRTWQSRKGERKEGK